MGRTPEHSSTWPTATLLLSMRIGRTGHNKKQTWSILFDFEWPKYQLELIYGYSSAQRWIPPEILLINESSNIFRQLWASKWAFSEQYEIMLQVLFMVPLPVYYFSMWFWGFLPPRHSSHIAQELPIDQRTEGQGCVASYSTIVWLTCNIFSHTYDGCVWHIKEKKTPFRVVFVVIMNRETQ